MAGGWRKMYKVELHKFILLSDIISIIKSWMSWTGHVACMGEMRNLYKILVKKCDEKRWLGKLRYRCNGNIKMDLNEVMRVYGLDSFTSG
jgi:hypothetical protein